MSEINPHQINRAVLRALGLEPGQRITKLVLTFEAAELPKLEITRLVDNKAADGLVTVIEAMQLKPEGGPT